MTVLVLGIAMFLPLGLYVTLTNLESINLRQDEWNVVTVYFQTDTEQADVEQLTKTINENSNPSRLS